MEEYTDELKAYMDAISVRETRRKEYLRENFPNWDAVSTAIDAAFANTAQRTIIKRMARLLYLFFKNTALVLGRG